MNPNRIVGQKTNRPGLSPGGKGQGIDSSSTTDSSSTPVSGSPKLRIGPYIIQSDAPIHQVARVASPPGAQPQTQDIVVVVSPGAAAPPVAPPAPSQPEQELEGARALTAQVPPGVSPRRTQSRELEESEEHERLCIVVWFLCGIMLFPLILSIWLFLVPFLMDIQRTTTETVKFPGQVATSASTRTTVGSTVGSTVGTTVSTTLGTTQSTQPPCTESVVLPTLPANFLVGPPYRRTAAPPSARPFFCLFNISRVVPDYGPLYAGMPYNYMFETLPFALCPYIVYWSVGIENGIITSRLPTFDQQHGFLQLRSITDAQGHPNIKILLTLGGYPEDSPHFTRVCQDPAMLQRLMMNVVNTMRSYRLDGVTVDWAEPKPGCGSPDDLRLLGELLRNLRSTFNAEGLQQAVTSVILDVNTGNEHLVDSVFSDVNYFFLATHRLSHPSAASVQHLCANITASVHNVLHRYANAALRVSVQQLCITEYAAPLVSNGIVDPVTGIANFDPTMQYAAIYAGCSHPSFCRDGSATGSCIVHRVVTAPPDPRHAMRFVVSNTEALERRANLFSNTCVLVLGLDYDSFVDHCGRLFRRYPIMEHLHGATGGHNVTTMAIVDGAPPC